MHQAAIADPGDDAIGYLLGPFSAGVRPGIFYVAPIQGLITGIG